MSTRKITHPTHPTAPLSGWILVLALLSALIQPACHALAGPGVLDARGHAPTACMDMPAMTTSGDGVFAVSGGDPAHHRLRYVDGQVSRNDSCMIRLGNRLNRRVPPMYVNGEPVGFC